MGHWRLGLAVDEVVWRPGAGELHLAVFQLERGGRVAVLVALDALVVDEVGDVEEHLAGSVAFAGDLLVERGEHAMHLHGDGAGSGLAFALLGGVFAQAGEVLFADAVHEDGLVEFAATVVDDDLEVHLGLAAKAIEVGEELALVGANGAAKGFVIREDSTEAEGQHGGHLEAVGNDFAVIDGRLLHQGFVGVVFADDDG